MTMLAVLIVRLGHFAAFRQAALALKLNSNVCTMCKCAGIHTELSAFNM